MKSTTLTIEVSHTCLKCENLISKKSFDMEQDKFSKLLEDDQEVVWEADEGEKAETGVDGFWCKESVCEHCKPHI